MQVLDAIQSRGDLSDIDPRVRVVATFAFAIPVALSTNPVALGVGVGTSVVLAILARTRFGEIAGKLAKLNIFMLVFVFTMPLFIAGAAVFKAGSLVWSREGLYSAGLIVLRANIILLAVTAMLGSVQPSSLGYSLSRLGFPSKLTHSFLFMVRYVEVIHHEYHRLRHAMLLRGFHPGFNVHTFRTFGNLAGMLLVRSIDRAERIHDAMKCRGFCGRFHVLTPLTIKVMDIFFAVAMASVIGGIIWFQWIATMS